MKARIMSTWWNKHEQISANNINMVGKHVKMKARIMSTLWNKHEQIMSYGGGNVKMKVQIMST